MNFGDILTRHTTRLPLSHREINQIQNTALGLIANPQEVTRSIELFIQRADEQPELKLPGMYIIDALCRIHQNEKESKLFEVEFEHNIILTVASAMETNKQDQMKIRRLIHVWESRGIFNRCIKSLIEISEMEISDDDDDDEDNNKQNDKLVRKDVQPTENIIRQNRHNFKKLRPTSPTPVQSSPIPIQPSPSNIPQMNSPLTSPQYSPSHTPTDHSINNLPTPSQSDQFKENDERKNTIQPQIHSPISQIKQDTNTNSQQIQLPQNMNVMSLLELLKQGRSQSSVAPPAGIISAQINVSHTPDTVLPLNTNKSITVGANNGINLGQNNFSDLSNNNSSLFLPQNVRDANTVGNSSMKISASSNDALLKMNDFAGNGVVDHFTSPGENVALGSKLLNNVIFPPLSKEIESLIPKHRLFTPNSIQSGSLDANVIPATNFTPSAPVNGVGTGLSGLMTHFPQGGTFIGLENVVDLAQNASTEQLYNLILQVQAGSSRPAAINTQNFTQQFVSGMNNASLFANSDDDHDLRNFDHDRSRSRSGSGRSHRNRDRESERDWNIDTREEKSMDRDDNSFNEDIRVKRKRSDWNYSDLQNEKTMRTDDYQRLGIQGDLFRGQLSSQAKSNVSIPTQVAPPQKSLWGEGLL